MAKVSIIITVYDYVASFKLEAVFRSWHSQSIEHEIILCEQSKEQTESLVEMCSALDVIYIHCNPVITNGTSMISVGGIRNTGALCSTGDYLYFADADIVVTNNNYLKQLLKFSQEHKDIPMIRPSFRRLILQDVDAFCNAMLSGADIYDDDSYFCFSSFSSIGNKIELVSSGESYSLNRNILHVHNNREQANDIDGKSWVMASHSGGLFCRKDRFIYVGGFCEEYYTWGCEDNDLHWKLNGKFGVLLIDLAVNKISLVHLEHPSRCEPVQYAKNIALFESRKEKGTEFAINYDLNNNNVFSNCI